MSIEIFEKSKVCAVCREQDPAENHYYRCHKIPIKKYFEENFPKTNLLTGTKLDFKDKDGYLQNNFNDKNELREWINNQPKDKALEYLTNWLKMRREIKGLVYTLGQFEARSLLFPSISFIIKNYGLENWKNCYKQAGLLEKYDYGTKIIINEGEVLNFIIDSREGKPLDLPNCQVTKLNFGDYSIENNADKIYFERKSLNDFLGTMSAGFDRFDRELQRCQDENAYLVVLIEETYINLTSYPFLPHMKNVRAKPNFIASRFRYLIQKYPLNVQFFAVDGRKEAVRMINKIFRIKNVKNYDLQMRYDCGEL